MITADLIQRIRKKIGSSPTAYAYFFDKLNDSRWLKPLRDAGYFKSPTPLIREGGYIQMPLWPESQYLVRIADQAPDEILEIIKNNLKDTDNERVMDDVVQMLLKMDVSKAVNATEVVKGYLSNAHFLIGRSVPDLIIRFAEDGCVQPALSLATTILEVTEDQNKEAELKKSYAMLKPQTKYRDYEYEQILKKITPSLAKHAPIETIKLYADLLQKTIDYEDTYFGDLNENQDNVGLKFKDKKDDLSFIWRPRIENATKYDDDPQQSLTTALITGVEVLLKNENIANDKKLEVLDKLNDNKYYIFKRIVEYALRKYKDESVFNNLYGTLENDKKLQNIINHPITSSSGVVSYHPTRLLGGLDDDELIKKLSDYELEDTFLFDRESLAKELAEQIKQDPSRFSKLLEKIASTKYEYLNESIQAFTEIIDDLSERIITNILESILAIYVGDIREEKERFEYYSWSKSSILRLIEKLASQKEDKSERLTVANLENAQKLVLLLCRDQDPTIKDENNLEPSELSINSISGNAMHGLVYLLAWMNRNKPDKKFYESIFNELDWHLSDKNDPRPAIRAVYGWRFEFLYGTDKEWTTDNINTIFSDDKLGEAAFNAYARFSRVYPDELDVLGDILNKQLPRLKTAPLENGQNNRGDVLDNFVQRIALLYWHFSLDLSEGSLMRNLLDTADAKYIKELTNFIGFRLYKKETKTTQRELNKLIRLWTEVVKIAENDPTKTIALEEFGTWFASEKFDTKWSLEQLAYSATKAKQIHLDFAALERMEKIVGDYPAESIEALNAMIDGARERWAIDSWSSHTKAILQSAMSSKDNTVKEAAKAVANKLIAKGYLEYREIIKKASVL